MNPSVELADFQDALTARAGFLRQWMLFFERFPVVLLPMSGEPPFPADDDQKGAARFAEMIEAQLTQLALPALGLPGLAVATAPEGGVPMGVQLTGPRYREDLLLAAGEAIAPGVVAPVDPGWA
jgi:amidase